MRKHSCCVGNCSLHVEYLEFVLKREVAHESAFFELQLRDLGVILERNMLKKG